MKINNKSSQSPIIIGPAVAVDTLIFAVRKETLNVLLIKISQGEYKNQWALPGGLVGLDETLREAAKRTLQEKGGVKEVYLEQLYSFSDLNRDRRGRSISVAYFSLVDSDRLNPKTTDYYSDIQWHPIDKLPLLAFDHKKIIDKGIQRLRNKIGYSNIVYGLLSREWTLTEMQRVYEIILGRKLDKRNFRKQAKNWGIVEPIHKTQAGINNRPAELFRFKKRSLVFTK